jgi:hypothetical protein
MNMDWDREATVRWWHTLTAAQQAQWEQENRRVGEVVAMLTPEAKADLAAEAAECDCGLGDALRMVEYRINVLDATSRQMADLINGGYVGIDDWVPPLGVRTAEEALRIMQEEDYRLV